MGDGDGHATTLKGLSNDGEDVTTVTFKFSPNGVISSYRFIGFADNGSARIQSTDGLGTTFLINFELTTIYVARGNGVGS